MLETYRGIPHLLDTWIVLTGMAAPIAISSMRRSGAAVPRIASLLMPAAFALIFAATLSPTAHRVPGIGTCGTHLTTTGGLTSMQGLLNVLLFIPAAALITLASGRPADGIAAGIGMSAAVEAIQALIPTLGRSCQLHDLITNTLGAFVGVGLAAGVQVALRAAIRPVPLVSPVYVVEHGAILVRRPAARHRRGELAPALPWALTSARAPARAPAQTPAGAPARASALTPGRALTPARGPAPVQAPSTGAPPAPALTPAQTPASAQTPARASALASVRVPAQTPARPPARPVARAR
ncbi:VanZ family protein [Kribbella sp. NPDC056861]|uniref:VanZ family protein n=1 Tax=Kribbella sp. NPDC056861 TaxID=3154857 RepID=UPI003440CF03